MYRFNMYGWYVGESETADAYTTTIPPMEAQGNLRPNWTGFEWALLNYTPPQIEPAQPEPEPETAWYIDIGPFFDRFKTIKMNVLVCDNIYVQAMIKDLQARKWVDLKRADVADGLNLIMSLSIGVTQALRDEIINTKPTFEEQRALLKLYFS